MKSRLGKADSIFKKTTEGAKAAAEGPADPAARGDIGRKRAAGHPSAGTGGIPGPPMS